MKIFESKGINTAQHWAVGTKWVYGKGVVEMHPEGFSCTCKKRPQRPCNHIQNVKHRMYGVFDEYYKEAA
jgi:hypothetical protein